MGPILDVCEVREEEIREQQLRDLAAQAGSLTIRNPAHATHAMSDSDAMFDAMSHAMSHRSRCDRNVMAMSWHGINLSKPMNLVSSGYLCLLLFVSPLVDEFLVLNFDMYCIDAFRTCINDPVFSGVVLVCIPVVVRQELRSKLAFMISHALGTLK